MERQEKLKHKKFSALWPPLSPHCALCIHQTSPIGRNTCLAIKSTILLAQGFPSGSDGKEFACNVGDLGSNLGLGRSHGGGHGRSFLIL